MSVLFEGAGTRFRLTARLEARSGLRIGRGRSDAEVDTDLPLLEGPEGPFVPGSSMKGVFRTNAEAILRGLASDPGELDRWACDFLAPGGACIDDKAPDAESVSERRQRIARSACRACATFGGMGLASHIRFADAPLHDAETMVRDGVAMDRDLARAADGLKYDYAVVGAGGWFTVELHMEAVEDWQVGLVLACLNDLDEGFVRIGGFGTRGLGRVAVTRVDLRRQSLQQRLLREEGEAVDPSTYLAAVAALAEA